MPVSHLNYGRLEVIDRAMDLKGVSTRKVHVEG